MGLRRPTDFKQGNVASDFKQSNVVVKRANGKWGPKVTWAAGSTDFIGDNFGTLSPMKSIDWGGRATPLL